jgi:uncharacterized protein (TIGR02145 family)
MNRVKITLTVAISIALALTFFACSSDDAEEGSSSCEDQTFRTVPIGNQTWMAENLNCDIKGSKCYDNMPENCDKYGRLYDWNVAKKVCPSGWHLPSNAEWETLKDYVEDVDYYNGINCCFVGDHLKATSGWLNGDGSWQYNAGGYDTYGFTALPGGLGHLMSDGIFQFGGVGESGLWWSSTEVDANSAYSLELQSRTDGGNLGWYGKANLASVRCVQD